MERRLGSDLSAVRVHADERAAASARAVDALAYTVGNSIVFGRGRYAPSQAAGRQLLAHELVHAIQQSAASESSGGRLDIDSPQSAAEIEARTMAGDDAPGGPQPRPGEWSWRTSAPRSVMRQPAPPAADSAAAPDLEDAAERIHTAIYGPGTDEEAIHRALESLNGETDAISRLVATYAQRFESSLVDDIGDGLGATESAHALPLLSAGPASSARSRAQVTTDVPALDPEPAAPSGKKCRTFADRAALDGRKADFAKTIASMKPAQVINWIIGTRGPPADARTEAKGQRDCMLNALRAAARLKGSTVTKVPREPGGRMYESFSGQADIWQRKFRFTGAPFDRITSAARKKCPTLPAGDVQWKPGNKVHKAAWATLTSDEKQREILQASSAPGISRHHWGSDADLFSAEPVDWRRGGKFADEYSWLQRNAATFGFLQSFTAGSQAAGGYIEERWHWSYYPVAQALLEFARTNQTDLEAALVKKWKDKPQFSYVRAEWKKFVFKVNETPRF